MKHPSVTPRATIGRPLQTAIRTARARLIIGYPPWLSWLLRPNVLAITLGHRIYLHRASEQLDLQRLEALIRHELVHVEQMSRLGPFRFLVRYALEYLGHRRLGLDHHRSYEAISFEREARAAEARKTTAGDTALSDHSLAEALHERLEKPIFRDEAP